MIDPRNINIAELPSVALEDKGQLPQSTGVYFVTRKKAVLYIGQSLNIKERWKGHHIFDAVSKLDSVHVFYWQLPVSQLDDAERFLIDEYQPSFNRQLSERLANIGDNQQQLPVLVLSETDCDFTRYLLGGQEVARFLLDNCAHKGDEIFWPSPEGKGVNLCVSRAIHTPTHPYGIRQSIRVKVSWDAKAQEVYESEYLAVRQKYPDQFPPSSFSGGRSDQSKN